MASRGFVRLERQVEKFYTRKGFGRKRALAIGRAVAGEVAHRKHRNPSARHCSVCGSAKHDARYHNHRPRRNPGLRGSVYGDPPEFHPYRGSAGYDPAKAGEEPGKKRRPRQLALAGLPRMTTVQARRVQARDRHARLVEHKRAHEDERHERARLLESRRGQRNERIADLQEQIEHDRRRIVRYHNLRAAAEQDTTRTHYKSAEGKRARQRAREAANDIVKANRNIAAAQAEIAHLRKLPLR